MGVIASQITSLTIVYSTIYSDADQRKHQNSASLAFVRAIHRGPVNSPHKWPVTRKMFPFDDVIMKVPKSLLNSHSCVLATSMTNECELVENLVWRFCVESCLFALGEVHFRMTVSICIVYHRTVELTSILFKWLNQFVINQWLTWFSQIDSKYVPFSISNWSCRTSSLTFPIQVFNYNETIKCPSN